VSVLRASRDQFRRVPSRPTRRRLLIGVVGEIFCRLTPFANESIIRKIEALGGEVVLAHLVEWIAYTGLEVQQRLRRQGRRWSRAMVVARLTDLIQHHDARRLYRVVGEDLRGFEEPAVRRVLRYGQPYLPHTAALGEMALSVGKAVFHYHQGCDGVADVSPFTCMNGIVTEAVYPRVSADLDGMPIRNFFVDSACGHIDRDLEIFMELARSYRARKKVSPRYPAWVPPDSGTAGLTSSGPPPGPASPAPSSR
jgi:predicted nucleotide-binding protein (sugar kinase/HSP70/actin superfamily)